MRFCMISIFYPPYSFGGDAIYLHRLCTQLVAAGHEVDVIHCADSFHMFTRKVDAEAFPPRPGITVHKLESGVGVLSPLLSHQTGLPVLTRRKIAAILASKKFDVVHYHNVSLFGPGVLAIDPPHPAVRLYTAHEHWLVCPMNVLWKNNDRACDRPTCVSCTIRSGRPPQWWRYTNMLERAARHVDLFLTPSQSCRENHRNRGFAREMSVLPYFLPEPAPEVAGDATIAPPRPYFLFVGRLEKIKGVQEILHQFRGDGDYDLVIVGGGMYEDQLREQAKGMSRVRFTGWLNLDEIASYYRHSLAVVVPSITYETFGIVVIEAFAWKKPVIVHDLGALPELVEESGAGFVYHTQGELRGHLDRLAGDRGLSRELGERGFSAFQEKWSPEPHLRLYHEYIRSVQERKFGAGPTPD
jgi:glycosyltransferase involved in cell wall biosynthesis